MPEEPVAVNVFARLHEADAIFAVCRRMRPEDTTQPRSPALGGSAWRIPSRSRVLRLIPMPDG